MTFSPSFPLDAEALHSPVAASVIDILAAQALREPGSVSLGMTTEELGLDSLGMTEVIFALEEHFDIAVPFEGMTEAQGFDLASVGGIVAAVGRLLEARHGQLVAAQ